MADGVWLLLPDKLTIRLFFEAGIVNGLEERLGERLVVVLPDRAEGQTGRRECAAPCCTGTTLSRWRSVTESGCCDASTARSTDTSATTRSRCA